MKVSNLTSSNEVTCPSCGHLSCELVEGLVHCPQCETSYDHAEPVPDIRTGADILRYIGKDRAAGLLSDMEERSRPGNCVCDEVSLSEDGEVLAFGYSCDKAGCNCTGGWWDDRDLASGGEILNAAEIAAFLEG